jgi:hypothetical protein
VTFSGPNAPSGSVQFQQLTSAHLTDTNEAAEVVSPVSSTIANFNPTTGLSLPPYSMTTLTWGAGAVTPPPPPPPPTLPAITNVAAIGVTATAATINWTTDQGASSQVEYGTKTSYGSLSANNPSLVTSHSVTLSGLTSGTIYSYAVISTDSAGTATSSNFTFATLAGAPATTGIAAVGGASGNTGTNLAPASLAIHYASGSHNTILAVCAFGSTASTISSIMDSGSTWAFRGYAANGSAVRTEIWSTAAGGSVASTSFTINLSNGSPTSCALEEYSGVLALGSTAAASGTSGLWSAGLTTQDADNVVVAALGANSYYGYANPTCTIRQPGTLTNNSGNNYVEMALLDTTVAVPSSIHCGVSTSPAPWAAVALELRSVGTGSAPIISSVTASNITTTSASITWTTDQPASSQVAYGTTAALGSLSAYSSVLTNSHTVNLSGLTPGTTYTYAVLSGIATSATFSFSTQSAPPVISNIAVRAITASSATINWTTDQPSTSQVQFGTTIAYGSLSTLNSSKATSHTVILTGLTAGATYNFSALSTNSAALTSASPNSTFATTAVPVSGPSPIVQNVTSWGLTGSGITIAWSTDQMATTAVQYGTTAALGQTSPIQMALTQNHGITLSSLASGTTYYFRAQSTNASNVSGYSALFTFTTLDTVPPVISNIQVAPAANHTAVVTWSLSEVATSQVEYGSSTTYGLWSVQTALTQSPRASLNWVPSGTIHYRIHSTDPAGNQAVSPDYTFTEP